MDNCNFLSKGPCKILTIMGNHDKTVSDSSGYILVLVLGSPSSKLFPFFSKKLLQTYLDFLNNKKGAVNFNQREIKPTQIRCPLDPHGFDLDFELLIRHCCALFVRISSLNIYIPATPAMSI